MGNISEDVVEALANEFRDIKEMVTENVRITRRRATEGVIASGSLMCMHLRIILKARRILMPNLQKIFHFG